MADTLIIGGTRNLGHITALQLLETGHSVSVLNRGLTADELPGDVERIRATRGDPVSLRTGVGNRRFDMVLDMTTYTGADAREAVAVFSGRVNRYVFISSGQVYLVREGIARPFRESDYAGPVMSAPDFSSADYGEWKYGADKRDAEAVFSDAWRGERFPVTTLRLPMVASERDHYGRIQGYIARIMDGNPILVPDEEALPLRHVYAGDVARTITALCESESGIGQAVNVSQPDSMSLADYLRLLAEVVGRPLEIVRVPRPELERESLLPDCSPFSGRWMSELDGAAAADVLGVRADYRTPADYLPDIFDDYVTRWITRACIPACYATRAAELDTVERHSRPH